MLTTIHEYSFNLRDSQDAKAYKELCAKMSAQGTRCFESWGGESHHRPELNGVRLTLETEYLFDNQWNTAPVAGVSDKGLRVFDWAQDYVDNRNVKRGHYLDLTPEMIEARANRMKCGYCGKQYDRRENPPAFCHACLGSQYLKESELKLVRVEPITNQTFAPLTAEEMAYLLPLYRAEQEGKGSERSRKAREDYGKTTKQIKAEIEISMTTGQVKYRYTDEQVWRATPFQAAGLTEAAAYRKVWDWLATQAG